MYEERGPGRKIGLATRSWLSTMQLFFSLVRPQLYSFQGTLPSLPLPALGDTCRKVFLFSFLFCDNFQVKFLNTLINKKMRNFSPENRICLHASKFELIST